jgi:hypothetical protein
LQVNESSKKRKRQKTTAMQIGQNNDEKLRNVYEATLRRDVNWALNHDGLACCVLQVKTITQQQARVSHACAQNHSTVTDSNGLRQYEQNTFYTW